MKKFLAVYYGSETGPNAKKWEALTDAAREEREQAGMQAWGGWVEKNVKALTDVGAPLGATKRVDASGLTDTSNELTAYTVVEAESHEAAAKAFEDHPHLQIPQSSIEVMYVRPMGGM